MIVWGGYGGSSYLNDGGRYNPAANSWTAVSPTGAPAARNDHTAVWTGSEMIVWGGNRRWQSRFNDGGRYNPAANSWTALSTTRRAHRAHRPHGGVDGQRDDRLGRAGWQDPHQSANDGGRYNPAADSWTTVPAAGAPAARSGHTAVWTGSEMIVWGGMDNGGNSLNDGGRYNPAANSWTAVP